jgi:hypothetical protein
MHAHIRCSVCGQPHSRWREKNPVSDPLRSIDTTPRLPFPLNLLGNRVHSPLTRAAHSTQVMSTTTISVEGNAREPLHTVEHSFQNELLHAVGCHAYVYIVHVYVYYENMCVFAQCVSHLCTHSPPSPPPPPAGAPGVCDPVHPRPEPSGD